MGIALTPSVWRGNMGRRWASGVEEERQQDGGGRADREAGAKKNPSWREEGLQSCLRWTACRTRGSRSWHSQPDLWKIVQQIFLQKRDFPLFLQLFVQLFVQLLKFCVSPAPHWGWRSKLFALPVRGPPGISQLFLQCGSCSSLSPRVWRLRHRSASAAKPHIVDAFLGCCYCCCCCFCCCIEVRLLLLH